MNLCGHGYFDMPAYAKYNQVPARSDSDAGPGQGEPGPARRRRSLSLHAQAGPPTGDSGLSRRLTRKLTRRLTRIEGDSEADPGAGLGRAIWWTTTTSRRTSPWPSPPSPTSPPNDPAPPRPRRRAPARPPDSVWRHCHSPAARTRKPGRGPGAAGWPTRAQNRGGSAGLRKEERMSVRGGKNVGADALCRAACSTPPPSPSHPFQFTRPRPRVIKGMWGWGREWRVAGPRLSDEPYQDLRPAAAADSESSAWPVTLPPRRRLSASDVCSPRRVRHGREDRMILRLRAASVGTL